MSVEKGNIVRVIAMKKTKKLYRYNLEVGTIAIVEKIFDEGTLKIKKINDFKGYYHDAGSVELIKEKELV